MSSSLCDALERALLISDLENIEEELLDDEHGDIYRAVEQLRNFCRRFEEITK